MTKILAIGLETAGCCVGVAGITVEAMVHAQLGYILITAGAVLVAIGGMLFAKVVRRK